MQQKLVPSLILSAAIVSTTVGCSKIKQKIAQKATEKATEAIAEKATGQEVDIDTSGNKVEFTGKDGKQKMTIGRGSKLPEDFPKSTVPVYPGSTVLSSMSLQSNNGQGHVVTLETEDSPDDIIAFYKSKFSGVKPTAEMTTPQSHVVSYADVGGYGVQVMAMARDKDGKSHINLTATPAKKKK